MVCHDVADGIVHGHIADVVVLPFFVKVAQSVGGGYPQQPLVLKECLYGGEPRGILLEEYLHSAVHVRSYDL